MVSSLNDEIDFRISFDESDDEDYIVVFDKNSFSYKIISSNDLKTGSENDNEKVNKPLFLTPEPLVSCIDDLDFFKDFKNEFPAIVYNDTLTSKLDFSTEPTLCPQHIDEFNLNDETLLSEDDEVEQSILYFNDLLPFNIVYPDDLKSDNGNDDNEIVMKQSSGDMAVSLRDQRHQYLSYEGLQYTVADIADFETRLTKIYKGEEVYELERVYFSLGNTFNRGDADCWDPMLRLCYSLIACSIAGRSQAPEKEGDAKGVAEEALVPLGSGNEDEEMPQAFCQRPTAKGVGLHVVDFHTGNHPKDSFTPVEIIQSSLLLEIFFGKSKRCGLSAKELNEFLSFYPIPSEYDVILPKSTETIFDAPPGLKPFGYAKLTAFIIMCTAYGYDDEEPEVQPAKVTIDSGESLKDDVFFVHHGSIVARIKERKCKTRGGSLRPPVKRKLAFRSSIVRAKNSSSKDDDPILSISDDDEGLPDCFELKDANDCHLKISAITPSSWKGHLDNQMDLELFDLHDRCYVRHAMVDNAVNRRVREFLQVIEKMRGEADVIKAKERSREEECEDLRVKCDAAMAEFDQNPVVLVLQEKMSSLTADVKKQKEAVEASLRRVVEEVKKDRRDVVLNVVPYAALELVHSDELGRLVGTLVSSNITYACCKAYEQVATMKEPFDLSKAKCYRSSYKKEHTQASNDFATTMFPWQDEFIADVVALIEALLSKKPPML
ncbi:hypothetical protein Tco_0714634 [Tanacetum coccineum]